MILFLVLRDLSVSSPRLLTILVALSKGEKLLVILLAVRFWHCRGFQCLVLGAGPTQCNCILI